MSETHDQATPGAATLPAGEPWMEVEGVERLPSPALLVHRERLVANLDRMLAEVGDPARLRPHIKTHKSPQIVALQVERGITKCKAATIAEAEMAAGAGATDILLATQPVGPAVSRLLALVEQFPEVRFRAIVDDGAAARTLGAAAAARGATIDVLVDIDVGQQRTGVPAGPAAAALCREVASLRGLSFGGLHAYDGHLALPDPEARSAAVDSLYLQLEALRAELSRTGLQVPRLVAGGTPTFPMHARRTDVECSPGTSILWDAGYAAGLPDLPFLPAAVLLARVISRPAADRICLDLGHKAVASEMPHPRVVFPTLPDAQPVVHSEEHLVLQTARAADLPVGSVLYGLPWHICPTVALHQTMFVVEGGRVVDEWPVVARQRRLTV